MNASASGDFDLQSLLDAAWLASQLPARGSTPAAATTQVNNLPAKETPPPDQTAAGQEDRRNDKSVQTTQARLLTSTGLGFDAVPSAGARPERLHALTAAPDGDAAAAHLAALPTLSAGAALRQALRPLLLRQSHGSDQLDEAATIEHYVRSGLRELLPLYEPAPRRRLRLSLIAETTPSSALWTQPLDEFHQLLRSQGVFRLLRRWQLRGATPPQLRALDLRGRTSRPWIDSRRLAWWPEEILVLASDFTAAHWYDGTLPALLHRWSATQPVLLLQLLPARLWPRSWSGEADAQVRAPHTAAAAAAWLSSRRADEFAPVETRPGLTLPLAALEPASLASWVRAVTGTAPAAAITLRPRLQHPLRASKAAPPMTPADRLARFRSISSPLAYRLARLLAVAAPLNFPVMRWVQQALLPQSDESHLAEFFLGGLLRRDTPAEAGELPADAVRYDFLDELRPLLQQGLPANHGFEVLRQVGAYLSENDARLKDKRTAVAGGSYEQAAAADRAAFALVSREFLARALGEIVVPEPERDASKKPSAATANAAATSPPETATELESPLLELFSPVIDLQWSPDQDVLSVLTFGGLTFWSRLTGTKMSMPLGFPIEPPPLRLLWYASDDGLEEPRQSALVNAVVKRVGRALGLEGRQPIVVQRLTADGMPALRLGPAVVLLFEQQGTVGNLSAAQIRTIEYLLEDPDALTISVRVRQRDDTYFTRARYHIELERMDGGTGELRYLAAELGAVVQWIRYVANREWSESYFGRGYSVAFCWCPNGDLVTAEQKRVTTTLFTYYGDTIRTALTAQQRTADSAQRFPPRERMAELPTAFNAEQPPATILQLMPVTVSSRREFNGIAWADDGGRTGVFNVPPQEGVRRSGSGLPHRLLPVDEADSWAFTHNGFGISLYRIVDGEQEVRHLNLSTLAYRTPASESELRELDNSISAAWVTRGLIYAVSEHGDLFSEIPLSAFSGKLEDDRSPWLATYRMPYAPLAVAACPPRNLYAVVAEDGLVALWSATEAKELRRWHLPQAALAAETPRLALTADARRLAVAIGSKVYIIDVPASDLPG